MIVDVDNNAYLNITSEEIKWSVELVGKFVCKSPNRFQCVSTTVVPGSYKLDYSTGGLPQFGIDGHGQKEKKVYFWMKYVFLKKQIIKFYKNYTNWLLYAIYKIQIIS